MSHLLHSRQCETYAAYLLNHQTHVPQLRRQTQPGFGLS